MYIHTIDVVELELPFVHAFLKLISYLVLSLIRLHQLSTLLLQPTATPRILKKFKITSAKTYLSTTVYKASRLCSCNLVVLSVRMFPVQYSQ